MNSTALIIDDNDDYVSMLLSHLEPLGCHFDRAFSATEGQAIFLKSDPAYYSLIITDITMEGQTAGLWLIRKLRRNGYKGILSIASTGFNSPLVLHLSKFLMTLWGVDFLIPKESLKSGKLKVFPTTTAGKHFVNEFLQ